MAADAAADFSKNIISTTTATVTDALAVGVAQVAEPSAKAVEQMRFTLIRLLRQYLGEFQDYIGTTGEIAVAAVLGATDVAGEDVNVLRKRNIAEKVSCVLAISLTGSCAGSCACSDACRAVAHCASISK